MNRTSYVPGRSPPIAKAPAPSVTVVVDEVAGFRAAHFHRHPGQHEARRIGDGTIDDRILGVDDVRPQA